MKKAILALLGIIIVALILRLFHLTILPIFADEAIYIRWAQVMANEPTLRFLPLSDGKQPLFMWILMFFVRKVSDPLVAGRLLSVASGIGTIIGLFLLTYYLFRSKKAALLAALIWAISPFAVFFDRMALVDSMLTMFGVWTLFLGIVTAKTQRLDFAMLTGFALGAASLTKSSALFFAVLLFPNLIFAKTKRALIKLVGLLFVTWGIAYVMYNIQRLGPNFQQLALRTRDYIFPLSKILANPLDPIIYNYPTAVSFLWILGPSTIIFMGLGGFIANFKKYSKEILILGLSFLAPLTYETIFVKSFTARYILFTLPPFYILAASLVLDNRRIVRQFLYLALAIFIAHALWVNYFLLTNPLRAPLPRRERSGYLEEWTAGTGISDIADFIKSEHAKEPNKRIVVGTEGYFGTLPDGLQIYVTDIPNVVVVGVGLGIDKLPQSLSASKSAGNKTYLVINNSRLLANPDKLALKLIKAYPKGLRSPGTSEYLTNGPQEKLFFFEVTKAQ